MKISFEVSDARGHKVISLAGDGIGLIVIPTDSIEGIQSEDGVLGMHVHGIGVLRFKTDKADELARELISSPNLMEGDTFRGEAEIIRPNKPDLESPL